MSLRGPNGVHSIMRVQPHEVSSWEINIFRLLNHFGILKWNGYNYKEASINNFPSHIDISLEDTIVTSSYSMIFPENIIIGTVKEINNDEGYYNILIHLFEDFNQLNYAYIVESKNIIEKKVLEKSIRNE